MQSDMVGNANEPEVLSQLLASLYFSLCKMRGLWKWNLKSLPGLIFYLKKCDKNQTILIYHHQPTGYFEQYTQPFWVSKILCKDVIHVNMISELQSTIKYYKLDYLCF